MVATREAATSSGKLKSPRDPEDIFFDCRKAPGGIALEMLKNYWVGRQWPDGSVSTSAKVESPWPYFKAVVESFSSAAPTAVTTTHTHEDAWGGGSSKGRANQALQKKGQLDTAHVWSERGLVATHWLSSSRDLVLVAPSTAETSSPAIAVPTLQEAVEIALNYGSADHDAIRALVFLLHNSVSSNVFNATLCDAVQNAKAPMRAALLLEVLVTKNEVDGKPILFPKLTVKTIRACLAKLQQFVDGNAVGIVATKNAASNEAVVAQHLVTRAPGADLRALEISPGLIISVSQWVVVNATSERSTSDQDETEKGGLETLLEMLLLGPYLSHASLVSLHAILQKFPAVESQSSISVAFLYVLGQAYKRTSGIPTSSTTLHTIAENMARRVLGEFNSKEGGPTLPTKDVIVIIATTLSALRSYTTLLELLQNSDASRAFPMPELASAICLATHRPHEPSHITESLDILRRVCATRSEWIGNIPPPITAALQNVAHAIGLWGEAHHVPALVAVIYKFNSPILWLNVYLDHITSGLVERVKARNRLSKSMDADFVVSVSALQSAIGLQRSLDTNPDTIIQLLEEMARSPQAVQLINSAVRVFGRLFESYPRTAEVIESNSERLTAVPREQRITRKLRTYQKTSRLTMLTGSYLQHNILCFLRDNQMAATAEHLAFLWKLDIGDLLESMRSVAPGEQLWECRSCHRFNNARYMYCSCNALRFSSISCPSCGLVQDERNGVCVACENSFKAIITAPQNSEAAKNAIIPREMWICKSCNASNPSFQSTFCLRCKTATGPCAKHMETQAKTKPRSSKCKTCNTPSPLGFELYPVCTDCGAPSDSFAEGAQSSGAKVWKCDHCGLWAPTTITRCPHCPQVELRGASVVREMKPVMCTLCNTVNQNCLQSECDGCGGALDSSKPVLVDVCTQCFTANPPGSAKCRTCDDNLQRDETSKVVIPSTFRSCDGCRRPVSPLNISIICENCDAYVPYTGTIEATHLVASCDTLLTRMENEPPKKVVPIIDGLWKTLSTVATPQAIEVAKPLLNDVVVFALGIFKRSTLIGCRGIALTKAFSEAAECSEGGDLMNQNTKNCPRCLSSHPEAVCGFKPDPWHCENCGKRHTNTGLNRYVCHSCLHSRPEMDMVSEAWVCGSCSRCVPEFESFCIFCETQKPSAPMRVPYLPTVCGRCNSLHLEAICPTCAAAPPNTITNGFGTVCVVTDKFAFIQPLGTSDPAERVFVQGDILGDLLEGQRVRFDAQEGTKKGQLKAIKVRESQIY